MKGRVQPACPEVSERLHVRTAASTEPHGTLTHGSPSPHEGAGGREVAKATWVGHRLRNTMSAALNELIERATNLPRVEKLRLMQALAEALMRDECSPSEDSSLHAEVWSPIDATDAAEVMLRVLRDADAA